MAELMRTPLFAMQAALGAKFVPFAGWEMPISFGSQIAEHQAVRTACGVFDVSHMTQVDVRGKKAASFLRHLLVGDVGALKSGRALYSLALNDKAGILDDLMVYRIGENFRVVFNASTREKMMHHLRSQQSANHANHADDAEAAEAAEVAEVAEVANNANDLEIQVRDDLAMLAVQGPEAIRRAESALGRDLATLEKFAVTQDGDALVARTGYTGEDGVEIMLPGEASLDLWQRLQGLDVQACGLGARDTLRLEAGLNLYGQDMDESNHPLESRLGWTIAWEPVDRNFVGRQRLQEISNAGKDRDLKGIRLVGKGVMRPGAEVQTPAGAGVVTSGSFSPTLGCSIGLARLPAAAKGPVHVIIRGSPRPANVVRPRFLSQASQEKAGS